MSITNFNFVYFLSIRLIFLWKGFYSLVSLFHSPPCQHLPLPLTPWAVCLLESLPEQNVPDREFQTTLVLWSQPALTPLLSLVLLKGILGSTIAMWSLLILPEVLLSNPTGTIWERAGAEIDRLMGVPDLRGIVSGKLSLEYISSTWFQSLFFPLNVSFGPFSCLEW